MLASRSAGGMGDTRLEPLVLSDAERQMLPGWATRRKTAQGLALRARIVLACAEGRGNTAVAARLGISRTTVRKWRGRALGRPAGAGGWWAPARGAPPPPPPPRRRASGLGARA